ncbi:MAG: TonB-dependent receptor [Bacteroidota bacterium]|nr:TonB-dependent receptor [Bacteroidota bacterium]
MKILFSLFFLFCFGTALFAQTTISGNVKEAKTGVPLYGANIIVVGKLVGTTTDSAGNFTLTVNLEIPFMVEISMVGFVSSIVKVNSNTQKLSIGLKEMATELDEVIVSASRNPERIMESPVSVERMDIKTIQNTSAPSFYEGLENLKGVDVNTNSFTFKSVNTRGFATFANTRFVQLVDGIDNSSPALNFALGNMLGISELDVNTVEILPGASSALYGANAFNGIMFMKSKNPFEFQGVSFYGKTGYTRQKAAGTNQFVDAGVRVAKAFSDKFAAKASLSFLNGTEWYATDYADYNIPGIDRSNPAYDGLNVYGDEVSTKLDFKQIALGAGVPAQIANSMGSQVVSRTGYNELDLIDYGAESLKADVSFNYRPNGDDLEIIYNAKFGRGNTIYQGANRYSIQDFTMSQHKLEVSNDHFFVRAYTTGESAGNSYDTRFAAININRNWKADTQWFTDYAGKYVQTYVGTIMAGGTPNPATIHQAARTAAQTGALVSGTQAFKDAFNKVISDPNLASGAKFVDDTRLYHVDANYNFVHLIKFADIQAGGSWRQYSLNSSGTIFTDYEGAINYSEIGAYTQLQKTFADDRIKFTGSIRYDKAKNFDGHFSPRIAFVYFADQAKNHNFRVSYQTGFRNPTTQDLYIGLDAGRAILVGSSPDNIDRYTSKSIPVSKTGQALGNPATVILSGRAAYDNSFSYSSILKGAPQKSNFQYVQPEKVKAYEIGYRGAFGSVSIDLSSYYNKYNDFIGNKTVVVPLYGKADFSDIHPVVKQPNALIALANADYKPFQVYTNSKAEISSYGIAAGLSSKIFDHYNIGLNYTWSKFKFDQSTDPDYKAGFNTPEHKIKASVGNPNVFKNFGFNVNLRWNDEYFWQSSFIDAMVPANTVIDAQINYSLPKLKSVLKLGGANIGGNEYFSAPGAGYIGSQYFASWTFSL